MRHGMVNRKLGRTTSHRLAMFRNQLASLIDKERIITTLPKAKELKPQIERLVTLGRTDSVHNRPNAARQVGDDALVAKLFDPLGPRFADRPGGYTRIVKLGPRRGDAAEMAILEFVGYQLPAEEKKAPALDFNALVLSLGSSAIVHLGEAPDPTTGQKREKPEFPMAQQSIDLLAMLQEKTRGNLTPDEARFLENMLFDLRMLFVQVSQRK